MAQEAPPKASNAAVAKAVFWSFFGVRKKKCYVSGSAVISAVQVIVAGLVGAVLFVLTLVMVVKLVTSCLVVCMPRRTMACELVSNSLVPRNSGLLAALISLAA